MTSYAVTDRGLRKSAARNDCRLEKTNQGWTVVDAVYGSLVCDGLTSTEVARLFESYN